MYNRMKRDTAAFFISTVVLALLAYLIQAKTMFSPDVGYLLHAANQVLAGGKYGPDIFEPNPPMILYLYFPVCVFAKWAALNIMMVMRCYIILLAVISLGLSLYLLKKIISQQDQLLLYFLYYTLAFGMLFLPLFSFAQREHILLIFMVPYLFSAVLALENKAVHPWVGVVIGIMAGLGFAIKPFFLAVPCLVELYLIIKQRNILAWIRVEPVIIIAVLTLYLISIYIFQPGYIHVIVPLLMRYYYPAAAEPWSQIIMFPALLFCFAVLLSCIVVYKKDRYSDLGWIIKLALFGMIVAFIIARTRWYYHILPALMLALLLLAHMLGQVISSLLQSSSHARFLRRDSIILILGILITLVVPVNYCYIVAKYIYQYQNQSATTFVANYLNTRAGQHSIACFGLATADCFPLVYDTHSQYGERFPALWWYLWTRKLEKDHISTDKLAELVKDKKYFIKLFADDLNRYKVRWVIIDLRRFQRVEAPDFDVIGYFLKDEQFKAAWRHYRYLTTIKSIKLYERIEDYESISSGAFPIS